MRHSKKTRDGRAERERLLTSSMRQAYARLQSSLPRGLYANDDLLDAFAACWSAERVRSGRAITLPASPPRDEHGLKMEIVV